MNTETLSVGGMTCAACSARVERALRKLEGVESAVVNPCHGKSDCRLRRRDLASFRNKRSDCKSRIPGY